MNIRRIKQVWIYGKKHAEQIVSENHELKKRVIFRDILRCYWKYRMWSNQYKKEKFWTLSSEQRVLIGNKYKENNLKRERWVRDYEDNHRFLYKWKSYKWECSSAKQKKRIDAYRKRYHMGEGCHVGDNVVFERHHYLWGTLKIGNHVVIAKNSFIDFTGDVIIEDGVKMADGVIIESHHRDLDAYKQGKDVNLPTKLIIRENAYIGSRAIILDSCNYIGKNTRVGAGAVVTKDVPDNAVVVGVPAKVIKVLEE